MTNKQSVFKRLKDRQDGLAAIEFALVLPFLVLVFIGVLVAYDSYKGYQRASLSSNSLADLTTRLVTIDQARMTSLLGAGEAMLGKYGDEGAFKINISSVSNLDVDEDYEIDWTESYTSSGGLNGDFELTMSILENIDTPDIPLGESLIIVRTELTFDPFFAPEPVRMHKIAVRNPRFVSRIGFHPDP